MKLTENPDGLASSGVPIYAVNGRVEISDLFDLAYELYRYRCENAACSRDFDALAKSRTVDAAVDPYLFVALRERAIAFYKEKLLLNVANMRDIEDHILFKNVVVLQWENVSIGLFESHQEKGYIAMMDPLDVVYENLTPFVMTPRRHALLRGCQ